jgi:hypothetical protein
LDQDPTEGADPKFRDTETDTEEIRKSAKASPKLRRTASVPSMIIKTPTEGVDDELEETEDPQVDFFHEKPEPDNTPEVLPEHQELVDQMFRRPYRHGLRSHSTDKESMSHPRTVANEPKAGENAQAGPSKGKGLTLLIMARLISSRRKLISKSSIKHSNCGEP